MPSRPALVALALALLAVAPASAAPAPDGRMTVVVLYFDNNTSDKAYDVLQKGLADMMVTDLSGVGSIQVVEREKLQKLIDELKLQRTRYFDPATAQRIGRGIGATHAVTGAIAAMDPQIRIDVRLVDVATAKVVMADKVVGTRDKFFDLEADLAARFATALSPDSKVPAASAKRNGSADLETAMAYSKGLDASDRGDYEGASKALATVVTKAPKFRLAQERYAALLKKLYEARARREAVLGSGEDLLRRSVADHLARKGTLEGDEKAGLEFLGYRTLACQLGLVDLGRAIGLDAKGMEGGPTVPLPANVREKAVPLMRAYFEEVARLSSELLTFEAAHPKRMPGSGDFSIANTETVPARSGSATRGAGRSRRRGASHARPPTSRSWASRTSGPPSGSARTRASPRWTRPLSSTGSRSSIGRSTSWARRAFRTSPCASATRSRSWTCTARA